jgi:hypothetical protein
MDTLNFKLDTLEANATSRLIEGNEDGNLLKVGLGAGGKKADKLINMQTASYSLKWVH